MMEKINRKTHVGKSSGEKEAYKNFLSQCFKLDKTEEDPENFAKTDSSNFEDDGDLDPIKPKKKSSTLKIKDFLQSNWIVTIGGGIIVFIVTWAFSFAFKQGVQEEKIYGIENKVGKIENKLEDLTTTVNQVDKDLDGLRIEYNKDMEYLKGKTPKR